MRSLPQPESFDGQVTDKAWQEWSYGVLLVGALLRVVFFFFATNNGGDALARATVTAEWLQHPTWALEFAGPHWLPLHFWMMAVFSVLVHNVMLGSRLLSLLLGTVSLWVFWCLARELYGIRAALLSLVIFTFYSLDVGYSTTSSSEATYLAFVLAALLCFFLYRKAGSLRLLALSGTLLTIAAGVRYEAWVFIFLMGALLVLNPPDRGYFSKPHLSGIAAFACTACLWPIFWMIVQWRNDGDPLFGIHHNADSIAAQLAINPSHVGLYSILLPPGVILLTLTPLALVGGLYALYLAVRESRGREMAIIAAGFAAIQFRSFATGALLAAARYTITDGTLLALIAGYGLYRLARKLAVVSYKTLLAATSALLILNLVAITVLSARQNRFMDKFRSVSPLLQYPEHIQQVGQFLIPRLRPADTVVIDNYNEESNIVAAAIGLPLVPGKRAFLASEENPERVSRFISAQKPAYIVIAAAGSLNSYVPLSADCTSPVRFANAEFRCVFRDSRYALYSASYPVLLASRSATTPAAVHH
jgi:4-amino-4-deoxy-L-arabinose transferase-like glycosyltransferase